MCLAEQIHVCRCVHLCSHKKLLWSEGLLPEWSTFSSGDCESSTTVAMWGSMKLAPIKFLSVHTCALCDPPPPSSPTAVHLHGLWHVHSSRGQTSKQNSTHIMSGSTDDSVIVYYYSWPLINGEWQPSSQWCTEASTCKSFTIRLAIASIEQLTQQKSCTVPALILLFPAAHTWTT